MAGQKQPLSDESKSKCRVAPLTHGVLRSKTERARAINAEHKEKFAEDSSLRKLPQSKSKILTAPSRREP